MAIFEQTGLKHIIHYYGMDTKMIQQYGRYTATLHWKKNNFHLEAVLVQSCWFNFIFGNRVCDEWKGLPEWVVNVEGVNKCKGNLDHYLRENMGFK